MKKTIKYPVFALMVLFVLYQLYSRNFSVSPYTLITSTSKQALEFPAEQNVLLDLQDPAAPWNTNTTRVKACFVVLVRNSDLHDMRRTIRNLEDRFNSKYNYPYIFLNDVPFTDEFQELTSSLTKAVTKYDVIPHEHWSYPEWIDVKRADEARAQMEKDDIIYGGSLPYRHMCRYESGFFFRHPLLDEFDYYWRVEPSVEFFCDIDYDPFAMMQQTGKKYGWTISLFEYESTIMTLWNTVKSYVREHPDDVPADNMLDFISNDHGNTYNLCHFWSNFEIGDLNFWRSDRYLRFFEYLDKQGGFFYERWGDAPVHSMAAALFLDPSEIHFFNDIGYRHYPFMHCPQERELQLKCHCNPEDNFDWNPYSCTQRWFQILQKKHLLQQKKVKMMYNLAVGT